MTAFTLEPTNRFAGVALSRAIGPVPANQEWSVAVRVCTDTDDAFDLQLRKMDGTNTGYRAKGHPVANGSGTQDIETRLVIPAGYELWDRSGAGKVQASYTGTFRSTL